MDEPTIPCPGCGTMLKASATGCQICLRGRSAQEITRTYVRLREEAVRRRRRPFVVAASLAAAIGAAFLLKTFWAPLVGALRSVSAAASAYYEHATDVNTLVDHPAEAPAAPAPTPPPAPVEPIKPPPAPPPVPAKTTPPPAHPPVPRAAAAPQALPTPSASQFVLYGRAFDLVTLAPAPGVALFMRLADSSYTSPMGDSFTTDEMGRFSVVMPRLQNDNSGYEIRTSDQRYAEAVQYEADIPYARLPAEERKRLVQNAKDGDLHPTPLADVPGEEKLQRDVFLSPRR